MEVRDLNSSSTQCCLWSSRCWPSPYNRPETNKIAKIWSRNWELTSQLLTIMPQRPLLSHVSRVFRRRVLSILSWYSRLFSILAQWITKMKRNRSLASRITAGSVDASDILLLHIAHLFDAFLVSCIYGILYHAIDRLRWLLSADSSC